MGQRSSRCRLISQIVTVPFSGISESLADRTERVANVYKPRPRQRPCAGKFQIAPEARLKPFACDEPLGA